MRNDLLDIADVVDRTGVPVSTLHVWEKHGLINPAGRAGLRRQYDPEVVTRIAMIIVGQRSGFTLAELQELFAPKAAPYRRETYESKLVELRRRRAEIDAAIDSLEHAVGCHHDDVSLCPDFHRILAGVLPVERSAAASR